MEDSDRPPTNIARLWRAYRGPKAYLPGVGTRESQPDSTIDAALGFGVDEKVAQAYWAIARAYKSGDRSIDLFGFSRGAGQTRALANLLHEKGIMDPDYLVTVARPTGRTGVTYQKIRGQRQLVAGKDVPIRFLGVFDTVLGGYDRRSVAPASQAIPRTVMAARQARAADENRASFGLVGLQDPRCPANPRIQERTFRGAHSDAGGGDTGSPLYQLPLEWMWSEAKAHGVPFGELEPADRPSGLLKGLSFNGPMIESFIHNSRSAVTDPFGIIVEHFMPSGAHTTRDITYPEACP